MDENMIFSALLKQVQEEFPSLILRNNSLVLDGDFKSYILWQSDDSVFVRGKATALFKPYHNEVALGHLMLVDLKDPNALDTIRTNIREYLDSIHQ